MNAEFIEALNAIEKERGINKEILIDAVENALISAYRRNYGTSNNVRAEVDRETARYSCLHPNRLSKAWIIRIPR